MLIVFYSLSYIHSILNIMLPYDHYCVFVCLLYYKYSVYVWFKSVLGNIVSFRVHAPNSGAFLLDIFANSVTPKEYLTGEPMKFKSVCKFKIICEELQTVMVPLPDCASGEWGPTKATRLFGLIPISHQVYTMRLYLNVKWHNMHKFNDYLVGMYYSAGFCT